MGSDPDQYFTIKKAIIEHTELTGGSNSAKRLLNRRMQSKEYAIIFYKKGKQIA